MPDTQWTVSLQKSVKFNFLRLKFDINKIDSILVTPSNMHPIARLINTNRERSARGDWPSWSCFLLLLNELVSLIFSCLFHSFVWKWRAHTVPWGNLSYSLLRNLKQIFILVRYHFDIQKNKFFFICAWTAYLCYMTIIWLRIILKAWIYDHTQL